MACSQGRFSELANGTEVVFQKKILCPQALLPGLCSASGNLLSVVRTLSSENGGQILALHKGFLQGSISDKVNHNKNTVIILAGSASLSLSCATR